MSESRDPSSIILRDFKIRPLALAGRRLASLVSLKLQIATKDAKIQKPMELFPDSEDVVWTTKGGVKVSCAADVTLSITSEDKGVITELCSFILACVETAKLLREHSTNVCQLLLKDDISSTQMLTIFTGMLPSTQVATALTQGSLVRIPNHYLTPKSVEFHQLYKHLGDELQESRAYVLHDEASRHLELVKDAYDSTILDKIISSLDEAVQCSSIFGPSRAPYLIELSRALYIRFMHTNDLATLNRAIAVGQDAELIMDKAYISKGHIFNTYGSCVMMRYKKLGSIEDLQLAISQYEKVVESVTDKKDMVVLSNLATALIARFERLGDLQDIDMAIFQFQKSLNLIPDGHSNRQSVLQNLGYAFTKRFYRLGNLDDLEQAITHLQIAVEHAPDDNQRKPTWLDNLGNVFQARFERLGNVDDLEAAIRHKQKAVKLTPDGFFNKLLLIKSLGDALEVRFAHLDNLEDIEAAVYYKKMAVNLTPVNHMDKPGMLDSLGRSLQVRFNCLGNLQGLEEAIRYKQMALDLTPDGHPEKPVRLVSLGNALRTRSIYVIDLDHLEDLDLAIRHQQIAIQLTPDGHPNMSKIVFDLGMTLHYRYVRLKQPEDLQSACKCYFSVATLVSAIPKIRLGAARQWALLSSESGLYSLPAYQVAIDMLPRIAWLGLPIHGQHNLLEEVGDVVRDAVGAALESGKYQMAVEWVEAGRSIAWQNFLSLRTPLDELYSVHPQLGTSLRSISQQLDMLGRSHGQASDQYQKEMKNTGISSQSLTQLGLDWERVVEEIRTKTGFEYFLKAKSFSQLSQVVRDGPVVILNVQKRGCAALLLIPEEGGSVHTRNIPLPDLSLEQSQGLHLILKEVLRIGHVRDRDERDREDRKIHRVEDKLLDGVNLELVLALLWKRVVRPVIDALAYQPRTTKLPRIWWCATGSLAFLPIHAAGIYDAEHEEPGHKLSDYAVSSYTPTLSALLDDSIPNSGDVSLLAVAQANAPGASRIPNTEVEIERIKDVAGEVPFKSLTGGDATIERVLEGMEKNNWVHLACHGQQNVEQPMKSGLLLHNGRLELENLISKSLPNADFAFLSACQTATGDDKIAEESVHLAAGMIFSGYKGIVATMWSINDSIAPQIAEDVYRYMLGDGKPDRRKAAHALHYAIKKLREEKKAGVLDWAPFIHIGR